MLDPHTENYDFPEPSAAKVILLRLRAALLSRLFPKVDSESTTERARRELAKGR